MAEADDYSDAENLEPALPPGVAPPPVAKPAPVASLADDYSDATNIEPPKPPAAPPAPGTTVRGISRNAAAGLTDAAANVGNIASDPFANLIGRPLLTAGAFGYDALAPVFGYNRMSPETRKMLFEDFNNQPGTRAVNAIGSAIGANPADVPANTPAERLTRTGVGGAATMAALGGSPVMGAAGSVAGDVAAHTVPEWAAPMADLTGNFVGGLATAKMTKPTAAPSAPAPTIRVTEPYVEPPLQPPLDPSFTEAPFAPGFTPSSVKPGDAPVEPAANPFTIPPKPAVAEAPRIPQPTADPTDTATKQYAGAIGRAFTYSKKIMEAGKAGAFVGNMVAGPTGGSLWGVGWPSLIIAKDAAIASYKGLTAPARAAVDSLLNDKTRLLLNADVGQAEQKDKDRAPRANWNNAASP